MLNLCVIIFIVYAVSGSAAAILFPKRTKKAVRQAGMSKRISSCCKTGTAVHKRKSTEVIEIKSKKTGRREKASRRPDALFAA